MKEIKLPFSSFDVFSNLIPAIVFATCLLLLGQVSPSVSNFFTLLLKQAKNLNGDGKQVLAITFNAVASASILFSLGHAIMALSSLFIDKCFVGKGLGYPYISLFKLGSSEWQILSRHFYLTVCSLMVIYAGIIIWLPNYVVYKVLLWQLLMIHIVSLIALKIVITSVRTYYRKNNMRPPLNGRKLFRYIVFFGGLLLPQVVSAICHFVKVVFNMTGFSDEFIEKFKVKYFKCYGIEIKHEFNDSMVFWLPYLDIHENRPVSSQSLQAIRNLYYFARNLCMAFFILFLLCAYISIFENKFSIDLAIHGYTYLALSLLFLIHYYNIYYNFYSKQTFRIWMVDSGGSTPMFNAKSDDQCSQISPGVDCGNGESGEISTRKGN